MSKSKCGFDYEEICRNFGDDAFVDIIGNSPRIDLNHPDEQKNILKTCIQKRFLRVLYFIKQKFDNFDWNENKFELLLYTLGLPDISTKNMVVDYVLNRFPQLKNHQHTGLLAKNLQSLLQATTKYYHSEFLTMEIVQRDMKRTRNQIIEFLLRQINQKELEVEDKKRLLIRIIDIIPRNYVLITSIAKFLGVKITPKSIREYIEFEMIDDLVKYLHSNDIELTIEETEMIIDVLVIRKKSHFIPQILTFYGTQIFKPLGQTPLLAALVSGDYIATCHLIDNCVFKLNKEKGKPLVHACINGWLDVVQKMVMRGAKPNIDRNRPIREACNMGRKCVVKYLLTCSGVDASVFDNYALDIAMRKNYKNVVSLLISDKNVQDTIKRLREKWKMSEVFKPK